MSSADSEPIVVDSTLAEVGSSSGEKSAVMSGEKSAVESIEKSDSVEKLAAVSVDELRSVQQCCPLAVDDEQGVIESGEIIRETLESDSLIESSGLIQNKIMQSQNENMLSTIASIQSESIHCGSESVLFESIQSSIESIQENILSKSESIPSGSGSIQSASIQCKILQYKSIQSGSETQRDTIKTNTTKCPIDKEPLSSWNIDQNSAAKCEVKSPETPAIPSEPMADVTGSPPHRLGNLGCLGLSTDDITKPLDDVAKQINDVKMPPRLNLGCLGLPIMESELNSVQLEEASGLVVSPKNRDIPLTTHDVGESAAFVLGDSKFHQSLVGEDTVAITETLTISSSVAIANMIAIPKTATIPDRVRIVAEEQSKIESIVCKTATKTMDYFPLMTSTSSQSAMSSCFSQPIAISPHDRPLLSPSVDLLTKVTDLCEKSIERIERTFEKCAAAVNIGKLPDLTQCYHISDVVIPPVSMNLMLDRAERLLSGRFDPQRRGSNFFKGFPEETNPSPRVMSSQQDDQPLDLTATKAPGPQTLDLTTPVVDLSRGEAPLDLSVKRRRVEGPAPPPVPPCLDSLSKGRCCCRTIRDNRCSTSSYSRNSCSYSRCGNANNNNRA